MDAHAHLKGLGWRGEGHSLDKHNRGLRKPLLIAHKTDLHGIGSKKQKEKQADQWWLNAFDNTLRDLGSGKESSLAKLKDHGINRGGLYGFFVRGKSLEGTFTESTDELTENEAFHVKHQTPLAASTKASSSAITPQFSIMARTKASARKGAKSTGANTEPIANNRITSYQGNGAIGALQNGTEPSDTPEKKRKRADEPVDSHQEDEPEVKKVKVVDGIEITESAKIEKKPKEPAKDVRACPRVERIEKQKESIKETKAKAIAEGTWDFEAEARRKKEMELERMVNEELRRREKAGEYGPILPHPTILLQYEKEVYKELKKTGKLGDLELEKKKLHEKVNIPGLNPNKKIKYKEWKYEHQRKLRHAKREIKGKMRELMFGEKYIPESEMTEEQLAEKKQKEREERRARRKESEAKQAEEQAERRTSKQKRQEEKQRKREEKKEHRRKTAEAVAAMKAENAKQESEAEAASPKVPIEHGPDQFAAGSDEIKLAINIDGRTRKIPGAGPVQRYPTKAEKRQKKLECRAYEAGITVEEYKAQLEQENEAKQAPECQRAAELQASRGGLTSKQWWKYCWVSQREGEEEAQKVFIKMIKKNKGVEVDKTNAYKESDSSTDTNGVTNGQLFPKPDIVSAKDQPDDSNEDVEKAASQPQQISEKKMAKYAAKATEKGLSVEEYIAMRESKKARKQAKASAKATEVNSAVTVSETTAVPAVASTNGAPSYLNKAPPGSLADKLLRDAKLSTTKSTAPFINGTTIGATAPTEEIAASVVGTAGDPHLNSTQEISQELGFVIDTAGNPNIFSEPKPELIWNPDMLGDRQVKELSKEERKARLEWMRASRAERHEREGKTLRSKKERHKDRMERKQKQRNRLVYEIMQEGGKAREEVSKQELEEARKKAKRVQREYKREKRNKVIHRKRLGGGLRGKFGGFISNGGKKSDYLDR